MKGGFPSLARRGFVVPTRLKAAAYESASTTGARAKSWRASSAGPNAAAAQNLPLLRSRARDAIRNDPWAKTAIARLVSNTIGNGIQAHPKHPNAAVRKMQKQLWEDSCEEIDADELFDMAGVQTLAARAFFSDGEVLVRRQFRSPSEGLAVPMQIRLLEGDLLPMEKN